jgi:predicted nucleotide-binding protein (sugar kinase/HSP70/actin superfamily)
VLNLYSTAVLADLLRRSGSTRATWCSPTRPAKRCGRPAAVGSVDPCYPSKVCQAHIHNLLFKHHEKKPLDYVFFPAITHIPTFIVNQMDTASCPVVSGTPKVIRAAFTKETDFFAERGISYLDRRSRSTS